MFLFIKIHATLRTCHNTPEQHGERDGSAGDARFAQSRKGAPTLIKLSGSADNQLRGKK
jgi:hypothetical protein